MKGGGEERLKTSSLSLLFNLFNKLTSNERGRGRKRMRCRTGTKEQKKKKEEKRQHLKYSSRYLHIPIGSVIFDHHGDRIMREEEYVSSRERDRSSGVFLYIHGVDRERYLVSVELRLVRLVHSFAYSHIHRTI
jgi:hypothetical protein